MAFRIDEERHINESIELRMARNKLNEAVRYQETTPNFVTYYHIDQVHSTTDSGFEDIADRIGKHSPMRYTRIKDFPLYGMEPISLQLQDTDRGLDTDYDSDAIILPGTLRPMQDDYFTIPFLDAPYLFRVTGIQYDTTMPDSYYRINFTLDYIDAEKIALLDKQVIDKRKSIFENIGSEKTVIMEEGKLEDIRHVKSMIDNMKRSYMALFYSDRYNVFLAPMDDMELRYLYDTNQTEFINKYSLFNNKLDFSTIILTQQVNDPKARLKYEKSVYRFIENPDVDRIQPFEFVYSPGVTYPESAFATWRDKRIYITDILDHKPIDTLRIFSDEFIDAVKENKEMSSDFATLIKRYIRKERLGLHDIPETLDEELLYLNNSYEVFFLTPIIMYIVKTIIDKETQKTER